MDGALDGVLGGVDGGATPPMLTLMLTLLMLTLLMLMLMLPRSLPRGRIWLLGILLPNLVGLWSCRHKGQLSLLRGVRLLGWCRT